MRNIIYFILAVVIITAIGYYWKESNNHKTIDVSLLPAHHAPVPESRSYQDIETGNNSPLKAVGDQNQDLPFLVKDEEIYVPEGYDLEWIINEFNLNQYDEKKKRLLIKLWSQQWIEDKDLAVVFDWWVDWNYISKHEENRDGVNKNVPKNWIAANAYGATIEKWEESSKGGEPISSVNIGVFWEVTGRTDKALEHYKTAVFRVKEPDFIFDLIIENTATLDERRAAAYVYYVRENNFNTSYANMYASKFDREDVSDLVYEISNEMALFESLYKTDNKVDISGYF